ncbi:MAG: hypothetical protein KDB61_01310 [Planctomycetes bacterium]|nr:hypothetical protein [Planctomycetota bacterium]
MRCFLLLAAVLCSPALAQSDDCSNPTPVSGSGSWSFDTQNYTTSSFDGGGCRYSDEPIFRDAFFVWQSPVDGYVRFDTYGSTFDTRICIHRGRNCDANCLDQNDDSWNLQSELIVPVKVGEAFLIQVGGRGSAAGACVFNAQVCDCDHGDGYEDNDAATTAIPLIPGKYDLLNVVPGDPDYFLLEIPAGQRAMIELVGTGTNYDASLSDISGNLLPPENGSGAVDRYWRYVNTTGLRTWLTFRMEGQTAFCTNYGLRFHLETDDCTIRLDDGFEDNDTCATPTLLTPGVYKGLLGSFADPDVYAVQVPVGMVLTVFGEMPGLPSGVTNYLGSPYLTCGPSVIEANFQYGRLDYHNVSANSELVHFRVQPYHFPTFDCFSYDLSVHLDVDTCQALGPDPFDLDVTPVFTNGIYADLVASNKTPDEYRFCVSPGATVSLDTVFESPDSWLQLRLEDSNGAALALAGSPSRESTGLTWTNSTSEAIQARLFVVLHISGRRECANYDLIVQGLCDCFVPIAEQFCNQPPSSWSAFGSSLVSRSTCVARNGFLDLQANWGPPGQIGVMLMSPIAGPGIVIGNGEMCLGGPITRFNSGVTTNSLGVFESNGRFRSLAGNGDWVGFGFQVPLDWAYAGTTITPGDSWVFQLWHRSPSGASAFSNANRIQL